MKKTERNSKLYEYLASQQLLDKGEEAIRAGKKKYRQEYLRLYKQKHRTIITEHTIALKQPEEMLLVHHAKRNGYTITQFIRKAAIAYAQQVYITPRLEILTSLFQQFILLRTQVERIRQEKRGLFQRDKSESIEALLQEFEQVLTKSLKQPQSLEVLITQTLQSNPRFLDTLQQIIKQHDCKINGQEK